MTTVAQVGEHCRALFTSVADRLAHESDFVQRRSKLTGAHFAQALVFGWLANPQAALPALAQAAAAAGVAISPQGLDQRCTESAAIFLEQLVGAALVHLINAEAVLISLLARFTALVLPEQHDPGLARRARPVVAGRQRGSAALAIQVRYGLLQGGLTGLVLRDGRTHDHTTTLQTAPLPAGALRVRDLGFFDLAVFATLAGERPALLGLPQPAAAWHS